MPGGCQEDVSPGPAASEECPLFVRVAAALGANVEVDLLTGLAGRLGDMAAAAPSGLFRCIYNILDVWIGGLQLSAEGCPRGQVNWLILVFVDAHGPNRVVEQLLPKVAFRLGGLVAVGRVPAPSHRRGHGNVGIRRRHCQLVKSADRRGDVPAHGIGAVLSMDRPGDFERH